MGLKKATYGRVNGSKSGSHNWNWRTIHKWDKCVYQCVWTSVWHILCLFAALLSGLSIAGGSRAAKQKAAANHTLETHHCSQHNLLHKNPQRHVFPSHHAPEVTGKISKTLYYCYSVKRIPWRCLNNPTCCFLGWGSWKQCRKPCQLWKEALQRS